MENITWVWTYFHANGNVRSQFERESDMHNRTLKVFREMYGTFTVLTDSQGWNGIVTNNLDDVNGQGGLVATFSRVVSTE